jgi:TRAP-type C4-dicarboxylate transport system permease small subunit
MIMARSLSYIYAYATRYLVGGGVRAWTLKWRTWSELTRWPHGWFFASACGSFPASAVNALHGDGDGFRK